MPKAVIEQRLVASNVYLKNWLPKVLSQPPKHNYKYPSGKVLKVIQIYNKKRLKGDDLLLCLSDSSNKILAKLAKESISDFELLERKRISMGLLNTDISIFEFKFKFLNDYQVYEQFNGLRLINTMSSTGKSSATSTITVKNTNQMNYTLRYAMIEINRFEIFNRDQTALTNLNTIPYIYDNTSYRSKYCKREPDEFKDDESSDEGEKDTANDNAKQNDSFEIVDTDPFPLY